MLFDRNLVRDKITCASRGTKKSNDVFTKTEVQEGMLDWLEEHEVMMVSVPQVIDVKKTD